MHLYYSEFKKSPVDCCLLYGHFCYRQVQTHFCSLPLPLGIGKFIALDFAGRGARVILACRSESRGTAALEEIREKTGNSEVHLRLVDLSSLDSVREFAERILEEEKALHILVNNAGVSGETCTFVPALCSFLFWELQMSTRLLKYD